MDSKLKRMTLIMALSVVLLVFLVVILANSDQGSRVTTGQPVSEVAKEEEEKHEN